MEWTVEKLALDVIKIVAALGVALCIIVLCVVMVQQVIAFNPGLVSPDKGETSLPPDTCNAGVSIMSDTTGRFRFYCCGDNCRKYLVMPTNPTGTTP
jgi:hypothetical protein